MHTDVYTCTHTKKNYPQTFILAHLFSHAHTHTHTHTHTHAHTRTHTRTHTLLTFCHSDGADWWMTKDHGGNVGVV